MSMHIDGLDELSVSLAELSRLNDDQIWSIIEPAADVVKSKMREAIDRFFPKTEWTTGTLHDSIEVKRKISKSGAVYALVGPNNKKHPKILKGLRKMRRPRKKTIKGTNAEIWWILNYGSERIDATHWADTACDEADPEALQLLQDGFNRVLEEAGF